MKQLVIEKHSPTTVKHKKMIGFSSSKLEFETIEVKDHHVQIRVYYPENCQVFAMRERQELLLRKANGEIFKCYWVEVPDKVVREIGTIWKNIQIRQEWLREERRREKRRQLLLKKERIKRYREQIASGKREIEYSEKDIQEGTALAQLLNIKNKNCKELKNQVLGPVSEIAHHRLFGHQLIKGEVESFDENYFCKKPQRDSR